MKNVLTIRRIIALAITIIAGIALNYLMLPAWSLRSSELYTYLFLLAIVAGICFFFSEGDSMLDCNPFISIAIIGIPLIILIIGALTGSKMFNAKKYQSLVEIKEGDFSKEVVNTNIENLSVVDVATAIKLGDRTLSNLDNPSWYEVDNEYNLILYNGTQYRISPINYGGLFKYWKASSSGIPGYILVNSVTQEAKLIKLENPIMYSPSAYFDKDLSRHLRKQYPSYQFGKSFFEIDDYGNPYWITSVTTANIGIWGGRTENSFIITDAVTGESSEYKVDDLPNWVDHAFDLDYLMDVIKYNFEFIHGYFNFSKTDVKRTSYFYRDDEFAGYNTTISSDGIVFYTGVTPANASESIIGFIYASPKTGEVKFYSCTGAEESSAQAAAQGLVQNLGYVATFPTIVNIEGLPTYFMILKDNAGLIQRYAFSNVENYSLTVQAPTVKEALALYLQETGLSNELIENNSSTEVVDNTIDESKIKSTTGTITFIVTAEVDGNTNFYFMLDGDTNLYVSSIKNSNKQVLLQIGTSITIDFVPSTEEQINTVIKIAF